MTSGLGELRELYPVEGAAYRFRSDETADGFTFRIEAESSGDGEPAADAESSGGDEPAGTDAVTLRIEAGPSGEGLCRTEMGGIHPFAWAWVGAELHLWLDGSLFVFQRSEPSSGFGPSSGSGPASGSGRRRGGGAGGADASGDILAPMPGAVLEVLVAAGDRVERGQTVALMESMKMELTITAPRNGTVRRVAVTPGQQVERGMRLVELAPESEAAG